VCAFREVGILSTYSQERAVNGDPGHDGFMFNEWAEIKNDDAAWS
jgi:hypothetical protein